MKRFNKNRISKLQLLILSYLLKYKKTSYKSLREAIVILMKISFSGEYSFKASFSRSLKNLEKKLLIKREGRGCYIWRTSFRWQEIQLTNRGRIFFQR